MTCDSTCITAANMITIHIYADILKDDITNNSTAVGRFENRFTKIVNLMEITIQCSSKLTFTGKVRWHDYICCKFIFPIQISNIA